MLTILDYGQPYAFEAITVGSTTIGLSQRVFDRPDALPVRKALIQVDTGGQIRYRIDAAAAVSSTGGHLLNPFDSLVVDGVQAIKQFSTIAVLSATNGLLSVTYFR